MSISLFCKRKTKNDSLMPLRKKYIRDFSTKFINQTLGLFLRDNTSPDPEFSSFQQRQLLLPLEETTTTTMGPSELPEDILMLIFVGLEVPDLVSAGSVCLPWRGAYTNLCNLERWKQPQAS